MNHRRWLWVCALALAAGGGACLDGTPLPPDVDMAPDGRGSTGGTGVGGSAGTGGAGGMGGGEPPTCLAGPVPGPVALRRLTRMELANTIRDLFPGRDAAKPVGLDPLTRNGFDNDPGDLPVTIAAAEEFADVAAHAAAQVTKGYAGLGCAAGAPEESCANNFVQNLGERVFRRPLEAGEVADFAGLYMKQRTAGDDPAVALEAMLRAMLQSADFLYRVEISPVTEQGGVVPVGPWEMASRLSYFLWSTMPDAELFAAARDGSLTSQSTVEAQARRMLKSSKARQTITRFHDLWLGLRGTDGLVKDAKIYPRFTSAVAAAMHTETLKFIEDVALGAGPGDAATFLTGRHTFLNRTLAAYYGVTTPVPATDTIWQRVEMDTTRRAGLLTHGALMATLARPDQTAPPQRGQFVRQRLLCVPPYPHPPSIEAKLSAPSATETTRERWEQTAAPAVCADCHRLVNQIGYGLENYDGAGMWRDTEAGKPIDASGRFIATRDLDGPFMGPVELAQKLAGSVQVRACVVTQWFRFASGRNEGGADACAISALTKRFEGAKGNIFELLAGMTQTDTFLFRNVEGG